MLFFVLCAALYVDFSTGFFVMVPLNMTCLNGLQHFSLNISSIYTTCYITCYNTCYVAHHFLFALVDDVVRHGMHKVAVPHELPAVTAEVEVYKVEGIVDLSGKM